MALGMPRKLKFQHRKANEKKKRGSCRPIQPPDAQPPPGTQPPPSTKIQIIVFFQLLKAKKGSIVSADGTPSAYIDSTTVELNGVKYSETVQHQSAMSLATMLSVKPVQSIQKQSACHS